MRRLKIILTMGIAASALFSCSDANNKADGYGNFEATEITVSSEASGKLLTFKVNEGDQIAKGKILGVIDTTQLYLKKEQLIAAKNTVFSKSYNVLSQRKVLLEQLKIAETEKNRVENLIKDKAATQKQLDDVNGQINVIKQQIKSVETQNSPIINEIKGLEIQIKQLDDLIKKCIVINPVTGTVLSKYAEPGEITAYGRPLYKIADLSRMELRVFVSETQLANIKIGQQVTIKVDSGNTMKSSNGKVSWIASEAEFTPKIIQTKEERINLVYAVKIMVENDGSLKIGMPAEMIIGNVQ
ncbi:MAG TPA: HlyD family efflux transporter periplasmic adaptor subunit [Fulvivirga sp.]|nr:HlyD family efflux transporter periplasmic adaptor subunit [Fulvivirga sp.]